MAGARFKTSIDKTGPFFRHDPSKTYRENAHDMMLAIAEGGRDDVVGQMMASERDRKLIRLLGDRVSDHVAGELRKRPAGPRYTVVVFVRNKGFSRPEAKSLMAAASRVESSIHAFRKTAGRIRRSREINNAELLKGLG